MKFIQVIIHNMSLRKTIRTILESVLTEEGKTITCQNCFHSWEKTPSDKTPSFCHVCGFDNKTKEFNQEQLKDWMKKRNQINESLDSDKVFSGEEVGRHIESITPSEEDLPDYFMNVLIRPRDFKIQEVNLNSLLNTDPDFKDYYNNGDIENRYEYEDIDASGIEQELVIVDGVLLDGYNRASTLLKSGQDTAYAFVALPK
jgi:hypothetical protein